MNKIEYLTIRELAEEIIRKMNKEENIRLARVDCDFATVDDKNAPYEQVWGWNGIKKVNCGFDSDGINLVADHYGGGLAQICTICEDILWDCTADVRGMISGVLEYLSEYRSDDDLLIVEWL